MATEEEVAAAVQNCMDEGYSGFKMQPRGGPRLDVPRLRVARETAGPDFPLMLDCYGQLTFRDALEIGHVLDELHFTWFEEPIPDSRIYQLKKLAQELRTPVIAGETITPWK